MRPENCVPTSGTQTTQRPCCTRNHLKMSGQYATSYISTLIITDVVETSGLSSPSRTARYLGCYSGIREGWRGVEIKSSMFIGECGSL